MPLKKGNTNIGAIYKGTTQIAKIYKGTKLLFENAKWLDYLFEHIYYDLIPTTISGKTVQDKARLTKIEGNGAVENQLVQNGNFEDASGWNITNADNIAYSNNTLSLTNNSTSSAVGIQRNTSINVISGRKYLVRFKYNFDSNISGNLVVALNGFSVSASDFTCDSKWHTFSKVLSALSNGSYVFYIRPTASTGNTIQLQDYQFTDLTLMFGPGNEPTTLTDNRIQALLNRGYIPYNTGEYKNSKVGEIKTFDTNNQLLDTITLPGLLELDGAINSHNTFEITNTDYVFTRNIGIRAYQSGDESLANVLTDLTNTYYPLATPQVITIPKKHLGCVNLGSLDWTRESYTYGGQSVYRFKAQVSGIKVITSTSVIQNLYCEKYMTDTANHSFQQTSDKIIALDTNGYVVVNDSTYSIAADFKSAMAGQYLFYETENEVSDFDNIAQINADGSITSNWFSWVRNQLVQNGNFSDGTNNFTFESLTTTTNDNILSGTTTGINFRINQSVSVVANHKYLLSYNFKLKSIAGSDSGRALYFADSADYFPGSQTLIKTIGDTLTDYKISAFVTPTISGTTIVRLVRGMSFVTGDTFDTSEIELTDLTLAFGAGKEPTSVNDPRIQYIISNGYIPYDTGTEESVAPEVLPNVNFEIKCK